MERCESGVSKEGGAGLGFPQTMINPELLSPAGNWDAARAAVAAGADAIYFGLSAFNARMRADNFTAEDLPELMGYLKRHGVRGFVAMNTLVFTDELEAAEAQLRAVAAAGVDALIVQDIGLAKLARGVAPGVELHASTQMTITSPEGLAFVESLFPLERAVLARELSISEIKRFAAHGVSTPLEVFVHGALCVAYSGQCLTSESLGQRSANRGECAQACRMPYELVVDGEDRPLGEVRYLLSPQDLAAVEVIPELMRAGVKSYKIEGRLKSPEYVAAVTRVYRKAIDEAMAGGEMELAGRDRYELEMTFSRGLTTGWLAGTNHPALTHGRFGKKRGVFLGTVTEAKNGWIRTEPPVTAMEPPMKAGDGVVFDAGEDRNDEQGARIWKLEKDRLIFHKRFSGLDFERIRPGMTLYKTSDPAMEAEVRKFWQQTKPTGIKKTIDCVLEGAAGEPLKVTATCGDDASVTVHSQIELSAAAMHPLTTEVMTRQLGRLGGTDFALGELQNRLSGDVYLPVSELNRLRRAMVQALEDALEAKPERLPDEVYRLPDLMPAMTAPTDSVAGGEVSVMCRSLEQVEAALECEVAKIYCDFEDPRRYREAVELVAGSDSSTIHLATPRILKSGEIGYLKLIERARPDGVLLRNLASLDYYKGRSDLVKTADFSLNVANPISASILRESAGLDVLTISYDLNIEQVMTLLNAAPASWFELTIHQHMPMFHMEHCVFCAFMSEGTSYRDCGRPCEKHEVHLRDRVGQLHRLQADVGCRNTLFNGKAQTGARFLRALQRAGLARYRVELLDEDASMSGRTIRAYQQLVRGEIESDSLLAEVSALEKLGVTEGSLQ